MATNVVDRGPNIPAWEDKQLLDSRSNLNTDLQSSILDESWAKHAFLVKAENLDPTDVINRGFSSAYFKFTDTSLGGAMAINPKPQFTRYADVREPGRLAGRNVNTVGNFLGNLGMGRYYSEAIDDPSQIIHMRFGVPQFNSLTTFFTGFYNSSAGRLAKTGRTDSFFGTMGNIVGLVASVIVWPILVINATGHMLRFFLNKPSSKFYYLKPTMITYWSAVNTMVNRIAINKGLLPAVLKTDSDQKINTSYGMDDELLTNLSNLMPDVISKTGAYDIYNVANKAQRIANALDKSVEEAFNNGSYSDFKGYVKSANQLKLRKPEGAPSIFNRLADWLKSETVGISDNTSADSEAAFNQVDENGNLKSAEPTSWFKYLDAEQDDGAAFANFRVDYTGPVSESFSNSVGESDLGSKINSISSQARSANFSFAGGNIIGGAIGSVIGGVIDAGKSFVEGTLDGIGLSGLIGLAGSAFVDIPKNWQSSSASLARSTYTMQLTSPYGNTVSQMNNLYIPLCMILAAAMPLSTGKQSYTSPFILELYDKGRCQTRLGMIDSLSITRGTGNLGFNKSGNAMAIDISFTVVDMSSVMHMPISKGFNPLDDDGVFDDETVYSDYMAILGGLDVQKQMYKIPKLKLALAKQIRKIEALTSPALWAMITHEKTPVGLLDVFWKGSGVVSR